MAYIKGVDVSSSQAEHFDASGSSFAFIKATQSTNYINARMTAQAAWSRSKGLVTGFYHFLVKGNIQAQAEYFVDKCVSVDGDILACDWETDPVKETYPSAAEKEQFIKAVKALRPTHKVVLYCNKSFWTSIDQDSYCGDGLWIAAPGTAGSPGLSHAWTFHQYSISGSTDRNVANFQTKTELANWAGSGSDDDMPLSDADIDKVADAVYTKLLKTDGVIPSGEAEADKANTYWSWQTHLTQTTNNAYEANQKLDAIAALLQDPAGFIAQIKTELAKVDIKFQVND
jgi:hypothetical protein